MSPEFDQAANRFVRLFPCPVCSWQTRSWLAQVPWEVDWEEPPIFLRWLG